MRLIREAVGGRRDTENHDWILVGTRVQVRSGTRVPGTFWRSGQPLRFDWTRLKAHALRLTKGAKARKLVSARTFRGPAYRRTSTYPYRRNVMRCTPSSRSCRSLRHNDGLFARDWKPGRGGTLTSINPTTGEPIAGVTMASAEQCDEAVAAAAAAFETWRDAAGAQARRSDSRSRRGAA